MAGGQVGRLSVRVLPDTTQFRRDLKKAMDRAEKSVKPTMSIGLKVTQKSLADVRRQLQGLEATVPVKAELTTAAKKHIKDQLDDIDATATVEAEVDTGTAAARLKMFTRPRLLPINVSITKSSLATATSALAALSGARVLGDFGRRIKNAVANLDRSLPSLAAGTTAIASLGAAGLAATSNVFALGASLASIAPAALVLPGIFAGFGVGLGVMIAALADAGTVLADLGPKFSALQDTISTNFWDRAAEPIRDLANNALPILNARLSEVASSLGGFTASAANAFNTPANLALFDGMLVNLRDSIDIASTGVSSFVNAIMGLGSVGATYLPALAGWFNDISDSFAGWVKLNTENGKLFEWIDSGIAALQDFGRVLGASGGILAGFATAAANAGGANLGALADGLERVNQAVNGPAFQGALTTTFQGAHDAMAALGPGLSAMSDAFVAFAPTLAEVLVLAGQIGSVALAGIAAALEQPAFQNGLTDFFEGILTGLEAILPHMPALASAFGSVASFAGPLAAVLGPVLGAAIEALGPVVTDLMNGLSAIAPVLGGVLVSAIQTLAPYIQQIVSAIVDWVTQNPQFAAGLLAAAVAVGGLVAGAISLFTALAPIIGTIVSIVSGLAGMGLSMSAIGAAIATVLGPVTLIVAAIAAMAAAFLYAWTQSAAFRDAVMGLLGSVMAFLQPIIAFITGTVVPVVMQVAQAFIGMVTTILDALIPFWTVMLQIWTEIINILTPVVAFITSVLAPVFRFLGDVISAVFTFIGVIISQTINVITAILQVFLAMLRGDWTATWNAIKNLVSVVWSAINAYVQAGLRFVWSIVTSLMSNVKAFWSTVWNAIKNFVVNTWSAIVSRVSSFIANLINRIVSFVNQVKSNIQNGFNAAKTAAINAFQRLVSGVTGKINSLLATVRALPGRIKSGLGNMASLLYSAGRDLIQGMINGVKDMAGSLVSAARGVAQGAVDGAKSLLGIHSPSTVFREIGEFTGEGMIIGLERKAHGVNDAMRSMVTPPSVGNSFGASGVPSGGRGDTILNFAPPPTDDPGTWGRRVADSLDLHTMAAMARGL